MRMDEGMDTGDILLPASLVVAPDETAGSLFVKLAELGAVTLHRALDMLRENRLSPTAQDHSAATLAPMLSKEHGRIDWSRPAAELHCWIRGMDPWPTAYSFLDGRRFRFFAPQVAAARTSATPGTLLRADGQGLVIATGSGALMIAQIQPEGGRRMGLDAYLCGHPLQPGVRFTDAPASIDR